MFQNFLPSKATSTLIISQICIFAYTQNFPPIIQRYNMDPLEIKLYVSTGSLVVRNGNECWLKYTSGARKLLEE